MATLVPPLPLPPFGQVVGWATELF